MHRRQSRRSARDSAAIQYNLAVVDYKALFEASFARVSSDRCAQEFFAGFYRRFMGSSPTIAGMFASTDLPHQQQMLRESLTELKEFSTSLQSNNYIVTLARVHGIRGRDVSAESYDIWLDALVATVREDDPECGLQTELAWRLVLAPGIEFMKFYYDK